MKVGAPREWVLKLPAVIPVKIEDQNTLVIPTAMTPQQQHQATLQWTVMELDGMLGEQPVIHSV